MSFLVMQFTCQWNMCALSVINIFPLFSHYYFSLVSLSYLYYHYCMLIDYVTTGA